MAMYSNLIKSKYASYYILGYGLCACLGYNFGLSPMNYDQGPSGPFSLPVALGGVDLALGRVYEGCTKGVRRVYEGCTKGVFWLVPCCRVVLRFVFSTFKKF